MYGRQAAEPSTSYALGAPVACDDPLSDAHGAVQQMAPMIGAQPSGGGPATDSDGEVKYVARHARRRGCSIYGSNKRHYFGSGSKPTGEAMCHFRSWSDVVMPIYERRRLWEMANAPNYAASVDDNMLQRFQCFVDEAAAAHERDAALVERCLQCIEATDEFPEKPELLTMARDAQSRFARSQQMVRDACRTVDAILTKHRDNARSLLDRSNGAAHPGAVAAAATRQLWTGSAAAGNPADVGFIA